MWKALGIWRVPLAYGIFSILWIIISDWVVVYMFGDPLNITRYQTLKGLLFVLVSVGVISLLIKVDRQLMAHLNQKHHDELLEAYEATLAGWAKALEFKDKETEGHSARVTEMTVRLGRAAGLRDEELVHLRRGAFLHDIGKMGIPDSILSKPGALDEEEWAQMRRHVEYGGNLLAEIEFLRPALEIPRYHHERWDGSGYPEGLKGEKIPLAGRLFAIVDVWDALMHARPYRPAWPEEQVRAYLQEQAGIQFDPKLVAVFLKVLDEYDDEFR